MRSASENLRTAEGFAAMSQLIGEHAGRLGMSGQLELTDSLLRELAADMDARFKRELRGGESPEQMRKIMRGCMEKALDWFFVLHGPELKAKSN